MKAGWEKLKFSELFADPKKAIISGPFGSNLKSSEYQCEGVPLVRLQNVDRWKFINKNIIYITPEKAAELSSHSYEVGDILITKLGAPLGKACIAPEISGSGIILADIVRVRLDDKTHNKDFIVSQLNSEVISDQLKSLTTGATRPRVTLKNVRELHFAIPPLAEQEEIVEVLDKAFAAIDQAKANLEQNIANAKELFQSKLNQIFSQKGAGWVETSLGSATGGVSTGPFGSLLHKKDYIENGIPLINPAHITDTGIEPAQNKTVTSETADRLSNYQLGKGDIVIARRGEMGRCAVVTNREVGWLCGTGSFFIKPSETSDPQYLVNLLRSTVYREKLDQIAGGATMKNLSNKSLSSFLIPLPPLPEQKTIVQHLDTLSAQTRALESHYQTKLTSLEELKKSLLQKAFAGELT